MAGSLGPVLAVVLYGAGLFALAWRVDRTGMGPRLAAFAFPLSLAVYCSSWTFFGGVGSAASSGWPYLSIYLGPILVFALAPAFMSRMAAMSRQGRATSISDLVSQLYGRSRSLAGLVAVIALVASVPYIALQLRSVSSSFGALAGIERSPALALLTAVLLAAFAISFGARRVEVAGRNSGLVAAIAVESLVKLVAFVMLGGLAVWLFLEAPGAVQEAGLASLGERFSTGLSADFAVQTLLSAMAILCLPRQFYMGFVEAPDTEALRRARLPFILYLLLISATVIPLALAGLALLPAGTSPDLFVLSLPMANGFPGLALLAFLGGFSAATGMVIAETLALSTMAANDLLAPLLIRRRLAREADLGRLMLASRRIFIILIIAAAYFYATAIDDAARLAAIGLIAFAGVAQFAPALIAAVGFGFSSKPAARAGLIAGGLVWAYTLLIPSFGLGASMSVAAGGLLDPERLFGLQLGSPLVHGTLWSLAANIGAMLLAFWLGKSGEQAVERDASFGQVATLGDLSGLVGRFVGEDEAAAAFQKLGGPLSPIGGAAARLAEQMIADVIGASSARLIITSTVSGSTLDVSEVVQLLDRSGQSLQFSRTLLEATLQAIDPGVSVVDPNLRLVAWNSRYLELFDYPPGMVVVGRPVAELIRFNAERGECGPGEVDAHVERRLSHLRQGSPHSFERRRPSGRWIKTVGSPMPGGGYVMSFTDMTSEKYAQAELEARVETRTADLARANSALAEEKQRAETATRDKTRFLAAASHDLLQPLHAARLFLSALDRQAADADRPLLANVAQSIRSADSLLRALLDVSKLDAGGITPRMERLDARALVEELGREFGALADEKGLRLLARSQGVTVETDRGLLRSILQNFLSNAVRYTGSGSIAFTARRRGQVVRFQVADSGPGIAESEHGKIFQEFERLAALPGGTGQGGVGLGLAIVERTARLLKVPVVLKSAPGRGSCFAVDVPLVEGWQTPAALEEEGALIAGQTVLCLDDDAFILEALVASLVAHGLRPVAATSAEQALALAARLRPAAALLDFQLGPGMDGLAVAERLRARDPAIRLALVTANVAVLADPRLLSLGITGFAKPVDPGALFAFLSREPLWEAAQ